MKGHVVSIHTYVYRKHIYKMCHFNLSTQLSSKLCIIQINVSFVMFQEEHFMTTIKFI